MIYYWFLFDFVHFYFSFICLFVRSFVLLVASSPIMSIFVCLFVLVLDFSHVACILILYIYTYLYKYIFIFYIYMHTLYTHFVYYLDLLLCLLYKYYNKCIVLYLMYANVDVIKQSNWSELKKIWIRFGLIWWMLKRHSVAWKNVAAFAFYHGKSESILDIYLYLYLSSPPLPRFWTPHQHPYGWIPSLGTNTLSRTTKMNLN